MKRPIESLMVDLFVSELGLRPDHAWIMNQNRFIPPTDGLFLTVTILSVVPISNNREFSEINETSTTVAQIRGQMQIDLFSRSNEALLRWPEVIMALNSEKAQQIQADNGFKLFELPFSMVNSSGPVGPDEIYRFSTTVSAIWPISKTRQVPFYSSFRSTVGDEADLERFQLEFGSPFTPSDPKVDGLS